MDTRIVSQIGVVLLCIAAGCASIDAPRSSTSGNTPATREAGKPPEVEPPAETRPAAEPVRSPNVSPAAPVSLPSGTSTAPPVEGAPAASAPEQPTPAATSAAVPAPSPPAPSPPAVKEPLPVTQASELRASTTAGVSPPRPPSFLLALDPARGGPGVEVPLEVPDIGNEAELSQVIEIAGARLTAIRYSPRVLIDERIVPAPAGEPSFPALRLQLTSRTGQWETWLVPGSSLLGRSTLPPAVLECIPELEPGKLAETEAFLRKLASPEPKILLEVKRDGQRFILPAREKEETRRSDPDCTVEVLRSFKAVAIDSKTGEATDQDSRPINPAVQVRIVHAGKTRTAWLFSQYPEFSREAEDEDSIYRYLYPVADHPHQRSDITLVYSKTGPCKVFVAVGGKLHAVEVRPEEEVRVASFTLKLCERIAAARIAQTPHVNPRGGPAVLLSWESDGSKEERWIPVGAPEELRAGEAVLIARLRAGARDPHAGIPQVEMGGEPGPGRGLPPGHPVLRPAQGQQNKGTPGGAKPAEPSRATGDTSSKK